MLIFIFIIMLMLMLSLSLSLFLPMGSRGGIRDALSSLCLYVYFCCFRPLCLFVLGHVRDHVPG